jgi:hypothetical protein
MLITVPRLMRVVNMFSLRLALLHFLDFVVADRELRHHHPVCLGELLLEDHDVFVA